MMDFKVFGLLMAVLASLQAVPSYAGSPLRVGNGVQGIEIANKVILRDFYDFSLTNLDVGSSPSRYMLERVRYTASGATRMVPMNLLAAKLAELNLYYPDLGEFVLKAFEKYEWSFVDEEFSTPTDDAPIRHPQQGHIRKALVRRETNSIQISRPLWDKMDNNNRTALIIHEGLFSISRPDCSTNNGCHIPVQPLREIIFFLFSPMTNHSLRPKLVHTLALPPTSHKMCGSTPNEAILNVAHATTLHVFHGAYSTFLRWPNRQKAFIAEACNLNYAWAKHLRKFNFSFWREGFTLKPHHFTPVSLTSNLVVWEVVPRDHLLRKTLYFANQKECELHLQLLLSAWYAPDEVTWTGEPKTCFQDYP